MKGKVCHPVDEKIFSREAVPDREINTEAFVIFTGQEMFIPYWNWVSKQNCCKQRLTIKADLLQIKAENISQLIINLNESLSDTYCFATCCNFIFFFCCCGCCKTVLFEYHVSQESSDCFFITQWAAITARNKADSEALARSYPSFLDEPVV